MHIKQLSHITVTNNKTKLRFILNDWCKTLNITSQYTVFYMLIQNDIVKKVIQITENSVCVMIKETELLIKFWVQTAQTDIYFCNWTAINFLIDDKQMTFKKTFINVKSFINHICIWECKCYSYIDSRSLSDRHNKFMN